MDRNSVIGLVLIAVILVTFSILNAPSAEEMKAQQQKEDSLRNAQKKELEAKQKKEEKTKSAQQNDTTVNPSDSNLVVNNESLPIKDSAKLDSIQKARINEKRNKKFDIFAPSAAGKKEFIVLENEKIRLTLSTKGGNIISAEVKGFKTYKDYNQGNDRPLMLFDSDSSSMGLSFFVNDIPVETKSLYFEPSISEKKGNKMVVMKAKTTDPKKYIEFVYSLPDDSYTSNFDIHVMGLASEGVTESIEFNWQARLLATEKLIDTERMVSSVFYKYKDETRDYLSETSSEELQLEAPTQWIAFKQSYFSVVLMSEEGINPEGSAIAITTLSSNKYIKDYEAHLNISDGATNKLNVNYQFYFGPNDYNELALFDNGMEKIVNIGWGIFGWVNMYLVIPIFNFLDGMNMSYWIIILLLTIIVKILIMPLTYKNYKSSAKMRVLKPEIEEITKKYKDEDPMKKQQATMALYRSSGVNPMAGCIPMLIQMPVLIAVFRFFPSAIQLRQQTFMWADDLSAYDSIAQLGFAIPFYGDHVSLFTLLMAASTILITRMNSGQMDTSMPGMKFMMYFFPVMMIFFFNNMAAGLSYYYLISNLLSMLIMWGIKKYFIDEKKIRMQIEANKLKPKASKKSKWQQRLEDMQKQRAEQMKKKK